MIEHCPLCNSHGREFYKNIFYFCGECHGIFRSKENLPGPELEKSRYEQHRNDVMDIGYREFVSPLTNAIFKSFSHFHKGLDFGAGPGPVVTEILKEKGYNISQYDPFFHNSPEVLNEKYDFVACCEVIEHFHNPGREFRLLKNLLKDNGSLFCMTNIYNSEIDFDTWYYKNDFTHVFIYQKETFTWIKENLGFSQMSIHNRLIRFNSAAKNAEY